MIVCNNSEKNLGTIKQGNIVNFEFEIENTSDISYSELEGGASCGCTAPRLEKHTLQPKEKMKIFVSFDTMGKKGHVIKNVFVKYKHNNEIIKLTMKFNSLIIE